MHWPTCIFWANLTAFSLEVLLGGLHRKYDSGADLWSLGVVFYRVLMGCEPFGPLPRTPDGAPWRATPFVRYCANWRYCREPSGAARIEPAPAGVNPLAASPLPQLAPEDHVVEVLSGLLQCDPSRRLALPALLRLPLWVGAFDDNPLLALAPAEQ